MHSYTLNILLSSLLTYAATCGVCFELLDLPAGLATRESFKAAKDATLQLLQSSEVLKDSLLSSSFTFSLHVWSGFTRWNQYRVTVWTCLVPSAFAMPEVFCQLAFEETWATYVIWAMKRHNLLPVTSSLLHFSLGWTQTVSVRGKIYFKGWTGVNLDAP